MRANKAYIHTYTYVYVCINALEDNENGAPIRVPFSIIGFCADSAISIRPRFRLDGGVVESWGSSINNTWEYNAVHDNEGACHQTICSSVVCGVVLV